MKDVIENFLYNLSGVTNNPHHPSLPDKTDRDKTILAKQKWYSEIKKLSI
jgi:hypothetical protein